MKKFFIALFSFFCLFLPVAGGTIFINDNLSMQSAQIRTLSALGKKDHAFFLALAQRESANNPKRINKFGYIGKYQFGEEALVALGYYKKDGSRRNDWRGKWTGKDGIYSKKDFLNSPSVQDIAAKELANLNWQTAKINKLDLSIGETVNGVTITKAGIIASMHLKGGKSVINFVNNGKNSYDGFGTGVEDYMEQFSCYTI